MSQWVKLGLGLFTAVSVVGCETAPVVEDAASSPDASNIDGGGPDAREAQDGGAPDSSVAMADTGAPDAAAAPDSGGMMGDDCARSGYPALSLEDVAPGFDWARPVFLTHAPGSPDLYVVDARGLVYIVRAGEVLSTPFLDIRTLIEGAPTGGDERGLLGLAFHPDYATNGLFVVAYTPLGGNNTLSTGRRSTGSPDVADPRLTEVLVIEDFASNHNGGMVAFGPDGYLYVGTGDGGGGGDPRRTAQDPTELLGKMLRIDVSGTSGGATYRVPADNPFVGVAGVREEIWAFGYRNPWRFSFDRETDEMYVADVGQGAWEEVDLEPPGNGGRNYGWSEFEGTRPFRGGDRLRDGDTHTPPIYEVAHDSSREVLRGACSITGGYVYRGTAIPALRGAYLFGDYCSSDVAAFRYCDGSVREPARLDVGGGVTGLVSFGEDAAGELYVISFGSGAQVRRIVAR
jgi:hypothetical protein